MRKLASIQRISELTPIEGKDRIELATVQGWHVIVQKGEYLVDDLCIFCEPDSVLPEKPEFEFLRSKKFRIKTMKMAGVVSQGICFPLSIAGSNFFASEGKDVTEILGIKHCDELEDIEEQSRSIREAVPQSNFVRTLMKNPLTRPFGAMILKKNVKARKAAEKFPDFIKKTDEDRIQNLPWLLHERETYVCREKLDGSSMTAFVVRKKKILPWGKDKYEYGICSRNRRLSKGSSDSGKFFEVSDKYNLQAALTAIAKTFHQPWVVVQGELIGPGIQKNRYYLDELDFYAFNLILPTGKQPCHVGETVLSVLDIKWCPFVGEMEMPMSVDEALNYATGPSAINPKELREGVVCRNYKRGISFKAVSPIYLLKHGI